MEIFLAVGLVVVIALSLLIIAVSEALLKQYEASLKEIDEELQGLKFVNKLKENIQIKKKPVKTEITIGKTQADFLCMFSDSARCMKNIEAALVGGDTNQAEAYKNHFINIIAPKHIDHRHPEGFVYILDMFDALASKKIFEQRCKNSEKTVDKKD